MKLIEEIGVNDRVRAFYRDAFKDVGSDNIGKKDLEESSDSEDDTLTYCILFHVEKVDFYCNLNKVVTELELSVFATKKSVGFVGFCDKTGTKTSDF